MKINLTKECHVFPAKRRKMTVNNEYMYVHDHRVRAIYKVHVKFECTSDSIKDIVLNQGSRC